jgi:hypothetical protein
MAANDPLVEIPVCGSCYNLILEYCTDELRLEVGSDHIGVDIAWILTDKNGRKYQGISLVNPQGYIEIETSHFPDGYFTPWSGNFTIEFFSLDHDNRPILCSPLDILICETIYTCITFSFASINTIDVEGGGYGSY